MIRIKNRCDLQGIKTDKCWEAGGNCRFVNNIANERICMREKLISVIIPVYKTDKNHLCKAIKSVINQSYRNIEIVLIDDGSPDQCGRICDSYSAIDERICVVHKKNGGVSSARNYGLTKATGDYILFMDSDDTLKRNAIAILFNIGENTNSDITICSCNHIKEYVKDNEECEEIHKKKKTVDSSEAIKNLTYNISVFDELEPTSVWGKLYKKEVVKELQFNEKMNIGEDFVFNYFALCNSKIITYCNSKLYNYNFVETSLMNNKGYSPKLIKSFDELVKFDDSQRESKYSTSLIVRCVNIAFTIYLKIPETKYEELHKIESYIRKNRKKLLNNKKTSRKVKIATYMSCVSFKLVRWGFNLLKGR